MAQNTTTPKIEELRFRLKTDPKNRMFYLLAEELRRIGQFAEAEQVLHTGLTHHATYLSAWVSLGRVLREQKKDRESIEALTKAMQLDPGNVVAARLLGDAYLEVGEKVEAIKKYKLVQALLPPDEGLEGVINRLDRELNAPRITVSDVSDEPLQVERSGGDEGADRPTDAAASSVEKAGAETPSAASVGSAISEAFESVWDSSPPPPLPELESQGSEINSSPGMPLSVEWTPASAGAVAPQETGEPWATDSPRSPFESAPEAAAGTEPAATSPWLEESSVPDGSPAMSPDDQNAFHAGTADAEPMRSAHDESPFEEPASAYGSDAFEIEAPAGLHIEAAPPSADVPAFTEDGPSAGLLDAGEPDTASGDVADVFAPAPSSTAEVPPSGSDVTDTLTMGDLYARQGLTNEAREIYEHVLQRDPSNEDVRDKLAALGGLSLPASQSEPEDAFSDGEGTDASAAPTGTHAAKVAGLQKWLAKIVAKREVSRVQ